jgi:hypothetical protein
MCSLLTVHDLTPQPNTEDYGRGGKFEERRRGRVMVNPGAILLATACRQAAPQERGVFRAAPPCSERTLPDPENAL